MTAAPPRWRTLLAIVFLRDVPFWNGSLGRKILKRVALLAYGYLGILLVLLALENYFLFPRSTAAEWEPPPARLAVRDVSLAAADGNTIHAWWSVPPGWTPEKGAVLFSHGNGGNLSHRGDLLAYWQKELDRAVLAYDYPGYGKSTGRPTEAGCYAAGEAAFAWLVGTEKVPEREVILLGESLGGAMAIELATKHPCRAVVTCGAFTSFPDMAQLKFPWLPARWLVSNKLDNLGKIGTLDCPVFLAHGTADTLIPYAMAERLYAAANEPKELMAIHGWPHAAPVQPEFFALVRQFLEQTRGE